MQIRYINFKIQLDHLNSNIICKTMRNKRSGKSYDKVAKIKKKEREKEIRFNLK